ncbi:MAG: hypothetical protein HUU11_14175 [Anaerolineales bacterium]|nr:hypothetical protein [Anaerolineales bacterium]
MKNKIVYYINVQDIKAVTDKELGRDLTEDEFRKVESLIGEKINWYDVILDSLREIVDETEFIPD